MTKMNLKADDATTLIRAKISQNHHLEVHKSSILTCAPYQRYLLAAANLNTLGSLQGAT